MKFLIANENLSNLNKWGVILNLILSIGFFISGIAIWSTIQPNQDQLLWFAIIFIFGSLINIFLNIMFWMFADKNWKMSAGILSLFFGFMLGGVLVLVKKK